MRLYYKGLPTEIVRIQVKFYLIENRTGYFIPCTSGTRWMDPRSCQNVPCGHLTHIFITHNPFDRIFISAVADQPGPLLCHPRCVQVVEEKRYQVDRLISMVVIL